MKLNIKIQTEEEIVQQGTVLVVLPKQLAVNVVPGSQELHCSICDVVCLAAPSLMKILQVAKEMKLEANVPVVCWNCKDALFKKVQQ